MRKECITGDGAWLIDLETDTGGRQSVSILRGATYWSQDNLLGLRRKN